MKLAITLTAFVALSALVTFAAPPATSESDQDSPNSLTESKAAIELTLQAENAKLTALATKLASKLQKSEAKSFLKAQASWAAWRDAEAEYLAHRYAPTEASSPEILTLAFNTIVSSMKIDLTESRVKRLEGELSNPHIQ